MLEEYSRYRGALVAAASVVLLGSLFYFHSTTTTNPTETTIQLHRRGAIVRRNRRDTQTDVANTPSWRAIAHLEQLERENGAYGIFRIETEDGRVVESGLLPSLLATRNQLMAEVGMPASHAERMRDMMEDTFLDSFLALDFPPNHVILENTPERAYLTRELNNRGISHAGIDRALANFNSDPSFGEALRARRQRGNRVTLSATAPAQQEELDELDQRALEDTAAETESVFSWRNDNADGEPAREGQNLLNLLYHIAEDQAKKDGYIHRGVTCNNCGMMPIQGIRYRCDNCVDFDLCENCEAQQVHNKTHVFLKIRIPAPYMGIPRQGRPVWYPGKPETLSKNLPPPLARRLVKETTFENTELDALWDQYRCLANTPWPADPNKLGMAIDRKTFDRCFIPNTSSRPPPPSLIFDRMFAFYDTNGDNLIGFEEFIKGISSFNNKAIDEKMRRIFKGYDVDGDGYVERKDFLRMFRAYYALIKELSADLVQAWEEDFGPSDIARDIVLGTRPISSAFSGHFGNAEAPRTGEGKRTNLEGDMEIVDGGGVLRPDSMDHIDPYTAVGDAAFGRYLKQPRQRSSYVAPQNHSDSERSEEAESEADHEVDGEPITSEVYEREESSDEEDDLEGLLDFELREEFENDVLNPLSLEEIRRRAAHERWRRRQFYTDEEDGATAPDGFEDEDTEGIHDSGDESVYQEQSSRPPSLRSRSSSKVRFEDDDYDVRSNGSTSVGERWGGFEVPEPERDIGKDILYQATKEGMNDLLDTLFKAKENLLMEAHRTRKERLQWAAEIESLADPTKPFNATSPEPIRSDTGDKALDILLDAAGYSLLDDNVDDDVDSESSVNNFPDLEEQPREEKDMDEEEREEEQEEEEEEVVEEDEEDEEDEEEEEEEEEKDNEEDNEELRVDPTLPQHRPNAEVLTTPPPTIAVATAAAAASSLRLRFDGSTTFPVPQLDNNGSNQAEATAPKFSPILKPSPSSGSPVHHSPELPPVLHQGPQAPPSRRQLRFWARLNQIERESIERGGGAKLNYDEFRQIMNTKEGQKLNFISTYIETASF